MDVVSKPQWIARMFPSKVGRDHLGLGSVSAGQILPTLLLYETEEDEGLYRNLEAGTSPVVFNGVLKAGRDWDAALSFLLESAEDTVNKPLVPTLNDEQVLVEQHLRQA